MYTPSDDVSAGDPVAATLPDSSTTVVILAAVEWHFIAQAQQILARRIAERGFNVVYVEPFPHRYPGPREIPKALVRVARGLGASDTAGYSDSTPDNLHIVSTLSFPETNRAFRWINRRLFVPRVAEEIRSLSTSPLIVQCWKPLAGYLDLSRQLAPSLLIYSCIENYPHQYTARPHYVDVEQALLKEADQVIAISEYVAKRLREHRDDLLIRDAAVDFKLFDQAATGPKSQFERLCFFGAVSNRLDFGIIKGIAEAGYEVLLLGPVRNAPIDPENPPPNIECHPPVPMERVPEIIADSDCILLPYVLDEYTKGVRFAKLYECLATGKPIIATPIPTLKRFKDLIYLEDGLDGFLAVLNKLESLESEDKYERRREIARQNTWEALVDQELGWMARGLARQ